MNENGKNTVGKSVDDILTYNF